MKYRRISLPWFFKLWLFGLVLFSGMGLFALIYGFIDNKPVFGLICFLCLALFIIFFLWAGRILLTVIEFYENMIIFKTIYGKIICKKPKEEIRAIRYEQEDMTLRGYLFRYYVFDFPYDEKYLVNPFRMDCNKKNEKLLGEYFPYMEIPSSDHFELL